MKDQLKSLSFSFDWNRVTCVYNLVFLNCLNQIVLKELATSNKKYYKWTQYLFLELYKNGLAYQKEVYVFDLKL